jgi:hypothetical protein
MLRTGLALVAVFSLGSHFAPAAEEAPVPGRAWPASRFRIDDILKRPYTPDVPLACAGDRVWASSPQGWAFRDDVHFLYLTNLKAYDIHIGDGDATYGPAEATCYPSHVHLEGLKPQPVASASFTYVIDNAQNPLTRPFVPGKRWTCWSSGKRQDWFAVDYGAARRAAGLKAWFYDDAPTGGCRPPEAVTVQAWKDGKWVTVAESQGAKKGENTFPFDPVETARLRLEFRNAGKDFYTGLYGFEPLWAGKEQDPAPPAGLRVTADKFITPDDVLVTALVLRNTGDKPRKVVVRLTAPWRHQPHTARKEGGPAELVATGTARLHDLPVRYHLVARREGPPGAKGGEERINGNEGVYDFDVAVPPGGSCRLTVAMALTLDTEDAEARVKAVLDQKEQATARQAERYQKWFDDNVAFFDCSDPDVAKMYYHRWYVLKKNSMDPRAGRLRWRAFSEGRWRSTWYPNVISYGAGHQIREARWLADPSYWEGHLRTFAHNERPDGVYPSHVTPAGQKGGQYTDWITAAALDGYLVHPDRKLLEEVADLLAANARGWDKVYAHPGTHLLVVDSHWWTGMEWQPSFFSFSGYKTDPGNRAMPKVNTPLMRIDLTAYNYGNARAVARVYDLLGDREKARAFADLAARTKDDLQKHMWDAGGHFFYSLRASDGKKADVKEVIGVYPFYFDLPDAGRGYERAWESLLDPKQFWTRWPVASASEQCPAYSQTGWPHDPASGTACMWNGPTWPHANSLVMSAMANTLRHYPPCALKREHLWELFRSFTRAQYRDGDRARPWTGEYYNGDDGSWKTAERDYNHSTYNDVLLGDLLGLVPRADDVLEIDPLLPAGALDRFALDGQAYHGHRVSLRWDAKGPQGGRFEVWIDGQRAGAFGELQKARFDLKTGKQLST